MVERIMDLMESSRELITFGGSSITNNVNQGVRTGCNMGPVLFLAVIAELLNEVKLSFPEVVNFIYADDLTCMHEDKNHLLKLLNTLSLCGEKYGLVVNKLKTDFISLKDRRYIKEGKLLGVWIGEPANVLNYNMLKANSAFYSFYHSLWSRKEIHISYKLQIFNSFCVSILLYGMETVAITKQQQSLIDSFCYKCYKAMLGIFYAKDGNVSRIKIFKYIESIDAKFQLASEILRTKRLVTWDHFITRNHKNDPRDFTVAHPKKFVKLRRLRTLIDEDLILRPSFITVNRNPALTPIFPQSNNNV
jgi:hypothetical protein